MNRDEFAAAALTGLLAQSMGAPRPSDVLVKEAYILADEMVRQQKPCADNFEIFEFACAASDAWAYENLHGDLVRAPSLDLYVSMKRLEEATRPRAMRKVRP